MGDRFNYVVNLDAKQGWREDASLGNPHFLFEDIRQRRADLDLKLPICQETTYELWKISPEAEIVKVRQDAVFPSSVVRLLQIEEDGHNVSTVDKGVSDRRFQSH